MNEMNILDGYGVYNKYDKRLNVSICKTSDCFVRMRKLFSTHKEVDELSLNDIYDIILTNIPASITKITFHNFIETIMHNKLHVNNITLISNKKYKHEFNEESFSDTVKVLNLLQFDYPHVLSANVLPKYLRELSLHRNYNIHHKCNWPDSLVKMSIFYEDSIVPLSADMLPHNLSELIICIVSSYDIILQFTYPCSLTTITMYNIFIKCYKKSCKILY